MKNLLFEIKYLLRQPIVYATFLAFFVLAFLAVNAAGGLFDSVKIVISGEGSKVFLNSPWVVSVFVSIFSLLGLAVTAALFGSSIYRDIKHKNDQIMFCTGIRKSDYLLPRFAAPLLVNTLLFLAIPLGITLASFMPYLNADYFGPFMAKTYITPLLQIALPNILFTGAIFFVLTALRKNTTINWIVIIVFYVLYTAAMTLSRDVDNQYVSALLDPFGTRAMALMDMGASASEKNTETTSLSGVLLLNRLLWSGLGLLIFIFGYFKYQLSLSFSRKRKTKNSEKQQTEESSLLFFKQIKLPQVKQNLDVSAQLYQIKNLFIYEFKKLARSTYFKVMLVLLLITTLVALSQVGKIYETTTYALTYQIAETVTAATRLLFVVFIILFTGELVWNSRKYRMHNFEDASPLLNVHFVLPKMFALMATVFIMLILQWLFAWAYQAYAGTSHEVGIMGVHILNTYLYYLVFIALAFIVNAVVSNRFIAFLILGIWYFVKDYLALYLKHNLLVFNKTSGFTFSEMNGFGGSLTGEYAFRFYWILFAVILLYFTTYMITRGNETQFKKRLRQLTSIPFFKHLKRIGVVVALFMISGGFIFYNTNILNEFKFDYGRVKKQVNYEQTYSRFADLPQPNVVELDTECHIYPESGKINYTGFYYLKNQTTQPIDTLILNFGKKTELTNEDEVLTFIKQDENFESLHLYELKTPLQLNDSVKISFKYFKQKQGFTNNFSAKMPLGNGTMFDSPHPTVGYTTGPEIRENATRKKYGLAESPALPSRDDLKATMKSGLGDFVRYHSIVSTSPDQTAFTSGELVKHWTENNRNFYEYQADDVLPVVAYNSAVFDTKEGVSVKDDTTQTSIDLAINYHKKHNYNIDLMMDAMQHSFDYYTENFGPYQFDFLRIVEMPRYFSYAISLATTVPFSEGLGFIANVEECYRDDEIVKIPYPTWVTAHEVAHQWWGHQIVPAEVQGAAMLTESLAQYSALKVLENMYDKEMVGEFLKNEQQRYAISRTGGDFDEPPLATVANEQHIFYNKGAVVFYALAEYMGEEKFNAFLSDYLQNQRFATKPYPTTKLFISSLRSAMPDSLKYSVDEWLEKVSLYNFEIGNATYQRNEDLTYSVKVDVTATKFQQNEQHKEEEIEMNEYFPVEIKNSKEKVLFDELVRLKDGEQTIELTLNRKPSNISIDPHNVVIHKRAEALNEFTAEITKR